MGFLSVIRRWALRDKMPIREIARRTGLSRRSTFEKVLLTHGSKRHRVQANWTLMRIGCQHGFWRRRGSLVKNAVM